MMLCAARLAGLWLANSVLELLGHWQADSQLNKGQQIADEPAQEHWGCGLSLKRLPVNFYQLCGQTWVLLVD